MGLSSVSVVTAILTLYLRFRDFPTPMPRIVKLVFFKYIASVLRLSSSMPGANMKKTQPVEVSQDTIENIEDPDAVQPERLSKELRDLPFWVEVSADIRYMAARLKAKDRDNQVMEEWSALASIVDRLMFWITTVILFINTIWFLQHIKTT